MRKTKTGRRAGRTANPLESTSNREPEGASPFEERRWLPEWDIESRTCLVRKKRAIDNYRRLQTVDGRRIGLYAQYSRNGALTTGIITCNSIPVDVRMFCVPAAIFAWASNPPVETAALSSSTRAGFSRS